MEGLCLYCVRPAGFSYDRKETFAIPLCELEAVAGKVNLDEFDAEEIQRKAQEDLNWIKEKSLAHEGIIEQAMRSGDASGDAVIPVIPMKFGTIFRSRENLEVSLSENYLRFKDSLSRLKGKQEWAVKAYLKKDVFLKWLEEGHSDIRAKKKEIAGLAPGRAFFARKKLNDLTEGICLKRREEIIQDMFNAVSGNAVEGVRTKNLARELTGKKEEMALNSYFLVEEGKLAEFKKRAEALALDYAPRGFQAALIGPLPPYHFAEGRGMKKS